MRGITKAGYGLFAGIVLSMHAVSAAPRSILLFIDSNKPRQLEMVMEINHELSLSPTFRGSLAVRVIDINGGLIPRFNFMDMQTDSDGKWVIQYKPRTLPWLICQPYKKTPTGSHINHASDLRRCLNTR